MTAAETFTNPRREMFDMDRFSWGRSLVVFRQDDQSGELTMILNPGIPLVKHFRLSSARCYGALADCIRHQAVVW
jgi:hypothetical protein